MRHKKIKIFFILLCLAVFGCGCQETPQEVKERMDTYGKNKQMALEDLNHCTVEELRETSISDINVDLDNMVLPEKVDFSEVEQISLLDLSFEKEYMQNQKKVTEFFGVDENSLVSEEEDFMGKGAVYDSVKDKKYLALSDNGFTSYVSNITYDYIKEEAKHKDILEQFDLDVDDVSGKNVEFAEGKTEISLMRDAAQKWLNENMPLENCEGRIVDVFVREFETSRGSKKQLAFHAEFAYKGIRFNSYAARMSGSRLDLMSYGVDLNYDGIDKLSYFSNGNGRIKIDSEEEIIEIIDFESAVRLVNEKVSGFQKLNISKILPVYILYPQYETDDELYSAPGQKITGRPAYAFLIRDGESDSEFGIQKDNIYKVVFVDMVTGEIITKLG